jgi:hypothetical protein
MDVLPIFARDAGLSCLSRGSPQRYTMPDATGR